MNRLTPFILVIFIVFVCRHVEAQHELRILPLGNSLTYGYYDGTVAEGNRISYRYRLYTLLMEAGYDFSFKGHISSGYNYLPGSYAKNGGISGIRDDQLANVMEQGYYYNPNLGYDVDIVYPHAPYLSVEEHQADLILLHIGTNDLAYDDIYSLSEVSTILDAIDDYESTYNDTVLVIVAKIIGTKTSSGSCTANWKVNQYNSSLETLINSRIASGDKIKLIDMQCGAGIDYNSQMIDVLHPTQAGYNLMGDKWFEAIDEIHNAPVISPISVAPINEGGTFATINLNPYVYDDYTSDANISWSVASTPVNLNVTINANKTVNVSPKNSSWSGTEVITLKATDKGRYINELRKSSTVDITFTVKGINDPPVILSQTRQFNIQEDQSFQISINDLEVFDEDNIPAELTLNILSGTNYTVEGYTVHPAKDFTQDLYVNVTVSDLLDESDVFPVHAYLSPVNDAPEIIGSDPLTIDIGERFEVTKDMLDIYDPDNSLSQITLYVLGGNHYSVAGKTVIPEDKYYGDLSVNLRVMDLEYLSELYSMPVSIVPSNLPPEFTSIPLDTLAEINYQYLYSTTASDPNDDPISFLGLAIPNFLTFVESTGILIGTPKIQDTGIYQVSLGATDGADTTIQKFSLIVGDPDLLPHQNNEAIISVYPNPAQRFVYISTEKLFGVTEIKLIDLSGRIVFLKKQTPWSESDTQRIDFGEISSGSYTLILSGDQVVFTRQIIIQNP
jgi:lysophospholipase L1-like esterase